MLFAGSFIFLALRQVNYPQFKNALLSFNLLYLAPAAVVYLSSFAVRALRWKTMLRKQTALSFGNSFSIIMISFMFNNVLPLRMGEFYRAHLLGKRQSLSRATALASIVLERAFDGLSVLAIAAIGVIYFDVIPKWIIRSFYLSLAGFGCVLTLAFLSNRFWKKDELPSGHREKSKWKGLLIKFAKNFREGFESVSSVKDMFGLFVFSMLVWVPILVFYHLTIMGFGVQNSFMITFLILGFQLLGSMMPNAPGFVGTFEYFTILPLALLGVDKSTALAIALVMHAISYVPVTAIGLILFLKNKARPVAKT